MRGATNLPCRALETERFTLRERLLRGYGKIAVSGRGTFKLARSVRESRPKSSWQNWFDTDAGRMKLDVGTYPDVAMAYGVYELTTIRTIRSLLRPGDHFLDVGANIGYVSLIASRIVGPTGKVDSIEPEPHNRGRLLENIAANDATNVTVHAVAASDSTGTATIHMPEGGPYNHGTSSFFAVRGKTIPTEVLTVRLDERVTGSPKLIKMDIEGAEPLGIAGMTKLFDVPKPPALVIEHNAETAGRAGFAPEEWLRRLLAIQPRYQAWLIDWRLKRLRDPLTAAASLLEANLLLRVP